MMAGEKTARIDRGFNTLKAGIVGAPERFGPVWFILSNGQCGELGFHL